MKSVDIKLFRNKEGFINLNNFEQYREKGEVVEGSNAKTWFNVSGVRFLFKEYNDVLPAFGEVLYSKLASKLGINCAEYDFAVYCGKKGAISYGFLGKDEVYYNFLELTSNFFDTQFSFDEIRNDRDLLLLHNNKYNNMISIKNLLKDLFDVHGEDKKKIETEIIEMFCLDTIMCHGDRNLWNYGIIINEIDDTMKLAPVHDNSCVLYLGKGKEYIEDLISEFKKCNKLEDLAVFENDDSIDQLVKFYESCDDYLKTIIERVMKFNVDSVVEEVNNVCKIDDVYVLWIKAVLNYRRIAVLKCIENGKMVEEVTVKPNIAFSKRK